MVENDLKKISLRTALVVVFFIIAYPTLFGLVVPSLLSSNHTELVATGAVIGIVATIGTIVYLYNKFVEYYGKANPPTGG